MLVFTFCSAASRLEARKLHLLEDANTTGTAYLRTDLLKKPQAVELQPLLKKYIAVHIQNNNSREKALELVGQSDRLQDILWRKTARYMRAEPDSLALSLFVQSMNEMFDASSRRVSVIFYNRIPDTIWACLYLSSIFAMFTIGYHAGLSRERRSVSDCRS